jgi:hypothetical protein
MLHNFWLTTSNAVINWAPSTTPYSGVPLESSTSQLFSGYDPVSICHSSLFKKEDELDEWKWYSMQGSQGVRLLREDTKRLQGIVESMLYEIKSLTVVQKTWSPENSITNVWPPKD